MSKVPVDAGGGRPVNHREVENHLTFTQAVAYGVNDGVDGIGYVIDEGEVLVDLDDCIVDGALNDLMTECLSAARTYAEISVSGRGCKLLVKAEKPGTACRSGAIEMYGPGFFAALTGQRLTAFGVEERQEWIEDLYDRHLKSKPKPGASPTRPALDADDSTVLRRARCAKNGAKFSRLFDLGLVEDYPSASEADYALVNMLRFWCGDAAQMDRLFRLSALMRGKWDDLHGGSTYGQRTIERAINAGGPVYRARLRN